MLALKPVPFIILCKGAGLFNNHGAWHIIVFRKLQIIFILF